MSDVGRILIATLVWLAAVSRVYGLHGLICGKGIGGEAFGLSLPRVLMVGAYALVIGVQTALLVALYHPRVAPPWGFVRFVSHGTGWVGLVAAIWSLFPVVMTTYCA